MTPPTVNADYLPSMNTINFPAGILQPAFYDRTASDATNYGHIGAIVGHELTHGFDDEGRKFDAQGNLRTGGPLDDAKGFEQRTDCLVNEYNSFVAVDDLHVNGKLTLARTPRTTAAYAWHGWRCCRCANKPESLEGKTRMVTRQSRSCSWLGTELVFDGAARDAAPGSARRRALTRSHSRKWRRREHAGVPPSLRLQDGAAHGAGEDVRVW